MFQSLLRAGLNGLAVAPLLVETTLASPLASKPIAFPFASGLDSRSLSIRQDINGCQGQSCQIAAISGSSGDTPTFDPPLQYTTTEGDCCVVAYRPEIAELAYDAFPGVQEQCLANPYQFPQPTGEHHPWQQPVTCKPKTLIWARGTFESDPLGSVGGPLASALQAGAPDEWSIKPSKYNADVGGIVCLGLPGGVKTKKLFERIARRCPDTKFALAGYSQGAMVVRNLLGNSTFSDRVFVVVTFGDPFNGAKIKNYNGPLKTYCADGDQVCFGVPVFTTAHSSYPQNTTEAAEYINSL